MIAPEAPMRACLAVLRHAILMSRSLGYAGIQHGLSIESSAQLVDLMDAVHNLPELLLCWEECDEPFLLHMLKRYDEKWTPSLRLSEIYERVRSGGAGY